MPPMSIRHFLPLLVAFLAAMAMPAHAMKPPLAADQLAEASDLITTGRVVHIAVTHETKYPDGEGLLKRHADRAIIAEYKVTLAPISIEKGQLSEETKTIVFFGDRYRTRAPGFHRRSRHHETCASCRR